MAQTAEVRGVATSVYEDQGDICIRYHATEVVRFNGKRIILNGGGWRTNTTKTRMNQAANQYGLGYQD